MISFSPSQPRGIQRHQPPRRRIGALLRPGKVRRTMEVPCTIRVDRFRQWLCATRLMHRPDIGSGLAVEIVFAAATEPGTTLRGTLPDVIATLRRLRRHYPAGLARQIPIDAQAARRLLGSLRPALVAGPNDALRLNPFVARRG